MQHIEIWKGRNAAGESVALRYVPELDTYYFMFNDRTNDLVSFDEQEIGKLIHHATDFFMTKNLHPEEVRAFMEEQERKAKKKAKKKAKEGEE